MILKSRKVSNIAEPLREARPNHRLPLLGLLLDDLSNMGVDRLKIGEVAESLRRRGRPLEFYNLTVRKALAWRRLSMDCPKDIAEAREEVYSAPMAELRGVVGGEGTSKAVTHLHNVLKEDDLLAEELRTVNRIAGLGLVIKNAEKEFFRFRISSSILMVCTLTVNAIAASPTVMQIASWLAVGYFVLGSFRRRARMDRLRDELGKLKESVPEQVEHDTSISL